MLDEPLSALDAKLREAMRLELVNLQHAVGVTFVFVTHDQDEALSMADRIVVMERGRVRQVADPATLYEYPSCRFVADFIGKMNLFEATVRAGALELDVPGLGILHVPCPEPMRDAAVPPAPDTPAGVEGARSMRGTIGIAVRPEKIRLSSAKVATRPSGIAAFRSLRRTCRAAPRANSWSPRRASTATPRSTAPTTRPATGSGGEAETAIRRLSGRQRHTGRIGGGAFRCRGNRNHPELFQGGHRTLALPPVPFRGRAEQGERDRRGHPRGRPAAAARQRRRTRREGFHLGLDADYRRRDEDGRSVESTVTDVGLDSRYARLRIGDGREWDLRITHREIPRNVATDGRTPYSGRTSLTLPNDWVAASGTREMTRLIASSRPFDYATHRGKTTIDIRFRAGG